ncbi:MAG: RNA polymerase sigma factor [Planctomycetaceae bacterium]|nr:RNA polymerase sigma factor [Planctomycetaceae bacterium]
MILSPEKRISEPQTVPDIDWEAKLRENESWLRTVIAAQVGEKAAIEDVWQDVSLAVIAQKSPIQDVTRVTPWLYQIAVRQSLQYRRKMGRRRKLVERYVEKVVPNQPTRENFTPLDILLSEERHAQVRAVMQNLEPEEREILLLKYIHGWRYREMAEKLGISVSAVQARLHRARQRLRQELRG